ncbi:tail fiber protein [Paenibacillus sp. 2TAF8]|uniref:tail fiber protein n=1 Tax=Paenibacillus sp. 2TAF8 TaxID=3233020 RepID=UPI003F9558A0
MPQETNRLKLPLPLGNENVTRESINGIFEKIDAGVATRESILIPAESDLNSYITEGEYYCPTNATVGTLANSPVGVAFHLTIERHAGVVQTLTTFEPSNLQVFQRNYYVGWGPWKKVPTRDEIQQLQEDILNTAIPPASLTEPGIVQLSNKTDGTSETVAATEKAVSAAFQAGVERKAEVVAALNSVGVSATTNESWNKLIPKLSSIILATGNVTSDDVIAGKTFSNAKANGLTGTIPDRGTGGTVVPGVVDQIKAEGRYTTSIIIKGEPNLIAGNLPKDKTFFGVTGALERMTTSEKQSIANQITAKGVRATTSDSNAVLAQKISMIETTKYTRGSTYASEGRVSVSGIAFRPKIVKMYGRYANDDSYFTACFLFDEPIHSLYGFITPDTAINGGITSGTGQMLRENRINNNGFSMTIYFWQYNQIFWEAWGY